ncbi:MAG: glycosyltransferase [Mariprofundus sp.]
MAKVLIIGSVWPEPTSSGAGLRLMEWVHLFLKQQWSITFASTAACTEQMSDLDSLGVDSASINVNDSSFDTFVAELQPDLVLFDRFSMEEQFGWRVEKHCPDALRLIETIDLHCLRHARQQLCKQQQQVIQHVANSALFNEIAVREIAAINRSDLSVLISDYEMAVLQERFSVHPDIIHCCPFMFSAEQINRHTADFEQRQHFVSIGNFRHVPNWDAVLWLKQQIWPRIRAQLPAAKLHVYGSYAPKKAFALHQPNEGFHLSGRADDVNIVMRQARVCLAPLRFGAGIKTKLADAMRNGTPNITTSVGAEAMSGGLPWPGLIADQADAFADAAVALYQNAARWQQARKHGFQIIEKQFDARNNGDALMRRIMQLRENLAVHRQENFTGLMLRHHHQRSTEFMSRWIEAKQHRAQESTPEG